MLLLTAFLLLSILSTAHSRWNKQEILVPVSMGPNEITFQYNRILYTFHDRRLTWFEAVVVCSAEKGGSLAIVDEEEKAEFLGDALSEVDFEMEDVWIGARAVDCLNAIGADHRYCFKWLDGKDVGLGMFHNRSDHLAVRDCLSFARDLHELPCFVDLYCLLRRPFLCEKPWFKQENSSTEWVPVGNYEYKVFHAKKTWKAAMEDCAINQNATLANFRNMEEVLEVGRHMLSGRPSLERAWTGAFCTFGRCAFVSDDKVLPSSKDPSTGFPPWPDYAFNLSLWSVACVYLDRHLKEHTYFLKEGCHEELGYVCSREIYLDEFETFHINDIFYTLYFVHLSWEDAYKVCQERRGWLVEVIPENMAEVLFIMAENRTEVNHVWTGGKLFKDKTWKWVKNVVEIEEDPGSNYPPWIDKRFSYEYGCLNMDRENHDVPMFYGLQCEQRQRFICEQVEPPPTSKPTTTTTQHPEDSFDPWKFQWVKKKQIYERFSPYFNWTSP